MNGKSWAVFIVIVVAVIGSMVYMSMQGKLDVSDVSADASNKIMEAEDRNGMIGDHVFGNPESKILLIEYGDFQCNPGCRIFHENFEPIMRSAEYKEKIAFVYRHFPITQSHPHALASASAAEAAGLQGKFWDMWNLLFANQAEWSQSSAADRGGFFEGYAKQLELDIDKFREDLGSDAVSKKIDFDRALANASNVTGTPTLFLNGKQVDGSELASTATMKTMIDRAIEETK